MTRTWWHGLIHFTPFTKYTTCWFYHEIFRHFLVGNVSLCRLYALEVHKPAFAPKKITDFEIKYKSGQKHACTQKMFCKQCHPLPYKFQNNWLPLVFVCLRTFDFKIIGSFTVSICMSRVHLWYAGAVHTWYQNHACLASHTDFGRGEVIKPADRARVCVCVCVKRRAQIQNGTCFCTVFHLWDRLYIFTTENMKACKKHCAYQVLRTMHSRKHTC